MGVEVNVGEERVLVRKQPSGLSQLLQRAFLEDFIDDAKTALDFEVPGKRRGREAFEVVYSGRPVQPDKPYLDQPTLLKIGLMYYPPFGKFDELDIPRRELELRVDYVHIEMKSDKFVGWMKSIPVGHCELRFAPHQNHAFGFPLAALDSMGIVYSESPRGVYIPIEILKELGAEFDAHSPEAIKEFGLERLKDDARKFYAEGFPIRIGNVFIGALDGSRYSDEYVFVREAHLGKPLRYGLLDGLRNRRYPNDVCFHFSLYDIDEFSPQELFMMTLAKEISAATFPGCSGWPFAQRIKIDHEDRSVRYLLDTRTRFHKEAQNNRVVRRTAGGFFFSRVGNLFDDAFETMQVYPYVAPPGECLQLSDTPIYEREETQRKRVQLIS